jgi:ribosomal protein S27E
VFSSLSGSFNRKILLVVQFKILTMYLVIRCGGCNYMMIAPDSCHYILCPVCGVTTALSGTRVYVRCMERNVAADIASQLIDILAKRNGKDLSEEEVLMLQQRFAAWERNHCWE